MLNKSVATVIMRVSVTVTWSAYTAGGITPVNDFARLVSRVGMQLQTVEAQATFNIKWTKDTPY